MDQQNDFMMPELFQGAAMQLLAIGTDDFADKDFGGCVNGDLLHLQVVDMKGEVLMQVVGGDSVEVAEQLVLGCLQNLSIEHLGALHLRPLNKGLQVRKGKE